MPVDVRPLRRPGKLPALPGRRGVTLLYTNSYDGTSNLVVQRLGPRNVFRFNLDLWSRYRMSIDSRGFRIENPAGFSVAETDIAKFYWRKPFPYHELFAGSRCPTDRKYAAEEVRHAMRHVVDRLWSRGKVVLVEPSVDRRIGKLTQMRLAEEFFEVPSWKFVRGAAQGPHTDREAVVKSLAFGRVGPEALLYTTKVREDRLDPKAPWLIQDCVDARADVTVAFVRGRLFAFELPRGFTDRTVDWREVALEPAHSRWRPHRLPRRMTAAIKGYMRRLSLDYGRLDFLLRRPGEYLFLEVNPNGEWAWLDLDGRHGLLPAILREVSPATPVHPIPTRPVSVLNA